MPVPLTGCVTLVTSLNLSGYVSLWESLKFQKKGYNRGVEWTALVGAHADSRDTGHVGLEPRVERVSLQQPWCLR